MVTQANFDATKETENEELPVQMPAGPRRRAPPRRKTGSSCLQAAAANHTGDDK